MKAILTTPLDWSEWIRFTDCVLGVGLVSTAMEQGALGCGGQLQAVHQTTREDGGVGKGGGGEVNRALSIAMWSMAGTPYMLIE